MAIKLVKVSFVIGAFIISLIFWLLAVLPWNFSRDVVSHTIAYTVVLFSFNGSQDFLSFVYHSGVLFLFFVAVD